MGAEPVRYRRPGPGDTAPNVQAHGRSSSSGVGALQADLRQAILNRLRDELRRKARRPDALDPDRPGRRRRPIAAQEAIGHQARRGVREGARSVEAGRNAKPSSHASRWLHLRRTGGSAGKTIRRSRSQDRPSCAAAARRGDAPCRQMTICSSRSQMRSSTGRRSTGRPSSPGRTAPPRLLGRLRVLSPLAHLHRDSPTPSLTQESTVPAVANGRRKPIDESADNLDVVGTPED